MSAATKEGTEPWWNAVDPSRRRSVGRRTATRTPRLIPRRRWVGRQTVGVAIGRRGRLPRGSGAAVCMRMFQRSRRRLMFHVKQHRRSAATLAGWRTTSHSRRSMFHVKHRRRSADGLMRCRPRVPTFHVKHRQQPPPSVRSRRISPPPLHLQPRSTLWTRPSRARRCGPYTYSTPPAPGSSPGRVIAGC